MHKYIFKSERLGFRNWTSSDIKKMTAISSDPDVMKYFPSTHDLKHTEGFIKRMQTQYEENGYCYYAVEVLETGTFIGFIGIAKQTYESDFTPCVDIGWRLSKAAWNKGYATEGAKKCLEYAFNTLELTNIKSVCPVINQKSEHVMIKIGMQKVKEFNHPLLIEFKDLERCYLYEINKP